MKYTNKKHVGVGLVALGSFLITLIYAADNGTQSRTVPHAADTIAICENVQNPTSALVPNDQFITYVDQLMTSTWETLSLKTGVTLPDCLALAEKNACQSKKEAVVSDSKFTQMYGSLSDATLALVREICVDFDINPNDITIIKIDNLGSPAGMNDFTLYIDEKYLSTFSPEAQRFIIAHELMHYRHKDQSVEDAFLLLAEQNGTLEQEALDILTQATEYRADITAMLKGTVYAQGGIAFFHEYMTRFGDIYSTSHPQPTKRLEIAQNIEKMHTQQPNGLLS